MEESAREVIGTGLFRSPWRKLARAHSHIENLKSIVKTFEEGDPYLFSEEADPNNPEQLHHKLKLTQPVPELVAEVLGDVINNLREALDYLGYTCAIVGGKRNPKHAYFPFGDSVEGFLHNLKRGGSKDIPKELLSMIIQICKPYKGGNDELWCLNKIANSNKHAILIPHALRVEHSTDPQVTIPSGSAGTCSIFWEPVWDASKQEFVFAATPRNPNFHLNCTLTISIVFCGVNDLINKREIIVAVDHFAKMVEGILVALEWEARRIFPQAF